MSNVWLQTMQHFLTLCFEKCFTNTVIVNKLLFSSPSYFHKVADTTSLLDK